MRKGTAILQALEKHFLVYKISQENCQKISEQLKICLQKIETREKAKATIIEVARQTQEENKAFIESSVTMALQSVFGPEYSFHLKYEVKRDQTELNFYVCSNGDLFEPRDDLISGGFIDVISFALRMVIWTLETPPAPPIMIFDEPGFKNVSQIHLPKVAELIKQMSQLMGIQIIMTTHIPALIETADNIIEI